MSNILLELLQSLSSYIILFYYKNIGSINVCVVADHIDKKEGYIITAYLTDRIKEGEQIYVKNKNIL